ncbi:MAG: hypothetical protein LBT40_01815 [Deltaproteobacteria bacterium]|nr:hypothetical protein [Deltaproteobacteria bacterium]
MTREATIPDSRARSFWIKNPRPSGGTVSQQSQCGYLSGYQANLTEGGCAIRDVLSPGCSLEA